MYVFHFIIKLFTNSNFIVGDVPQLSIDHIGELLTHSSSLQELAILNEGIPLDIEPVANALIHHQSLTSLKLGNIIIIIIILLFILRNFDC